MQTIADRFQLEPLSDSQQQDLADADELALVFEATHGGMDISDWDLRFGPNHRCIRKLTYNPLPHYAAKELFLKRFERLFS